MSREGFSAIFRDPSSVAGNGQRIDVQFFEGLAIQAAGGTDYEPFDFDWDGHGGASGSGFVPGIIQYDPGNWLNPSTHAYSGGAMGSGTVAAKSSIILPQDGLYWMRAQYKASVTGSPGSSDTISFAVHLGCNDDLLDGAVGFNWVQAQDDALPDFTVYNPRPLSGDWLLAFNEDDVLFWGLLNDSTSASVQAFQMVWQIGYFGPLP